MGKVLSEKESLSIPKSFAVTEQNYIDLSDRFKLGNNSCKYQNIFRSANNNFTQYFPCLCINPYHSNLLALVKVDLV